MTVIAERVAGHVHPLIAELVRDPSGTDAFWARVAETKAPLIAPDPERPGHSLVTFVFPRPEGARHVVVQAGVDQPPRSRLMDEVPGTNVCHASFRYRNDVRTHYGFAPDQPLTAWDDLDEAGWRELLAFLEAHPPAPDPHHRAFTSDRMGEGKPDVIGSLLELPDAPDQSVAEKRADVARGWIDTRSFRSEVLGDERRVWVYSPPSYDAAKRYPVIVAFDGGAALTRTPTHRILDNLIADGAIAPAIAILVDNATDTSRNLDLPCSEPFAQFIESELMPWARDKYAISQDPKDGYVTGVSYGGLASMWLGYRLPHVFGNVIAQAPSLWWGPGFDTQRPRHLQTYDTEWLTQRYAETPPRLPLRIWMEIGLMESGPIMIEPNRRMKAVLEEKGYDLTYSEPAGAHDYALWRGTFADALKVMLPAK